MILCGFLSVPEWEQESNRGLQLVELFAGVARIAKLGQWFGLNTRAFDINYLPLPNKYTKKRGKHRRPAMDLNGQAGLVHLVLHFVATFLIMLQYTPNAWLKNNFNDGWL